MKFHRAYCVAGALLLWFMLAACSKEESKNTPPPASSSSSPSYSSQSSQAAPASAPAAAPSGGVLGSGQFSDDPNLRCDLLEVKRVSGGALMIKWRLVNTAGSSSGGLVASQPKDIYYAPPYEHLYYVDPAENKKYSYLTDSENHPISDLFSGYIGAGQQRLNWAKFPAPPAASAKISVSIPKFAPFEDVPVAQ